MELFVFSLLISPLMIVRILYLIIIIESEAWPICLGLCHETMVCAVCLSIFVLIVVCVCRLNFLLLNWTEPMDICTDFPQNQNVQDKYKAFNIEYIQYFMIIFFYGDAGEFFGVSMFYPNSSYAVGIMFFFILDRYIPRAYGIVIIFLSDSAYVTWSQIHACRPHGNLMSDPGNHNDTSLFPRSSMANIFKS